METQKRPRLIIQKQRLHNKENHDQIVKDLAKNQNLRKKMEAVMELQYNKKNEEKTQIKKDVQILRDLDEDFDPSLYVKKKKESSEEGEWEEVLNSGEINSYTEMCELYSDLCNSSGVKVLIINGFIKHKGYKVGDSIHKYKWKE